VKPIAALVIPSGVLLIGVRANQGRVDIEAFESEGRTAKLPLERSWLLRHFTCPGRLTAHLLDPRMRITLCPHKPAEPKGPSGPWNRQTAGITEATKERSEAGPERFVRPGRRPSIKLGPLAACRKAENCGAQRLASSVTVCYHRPLGVARFHSRLCPLHQNSEAQSVKLSGVASRRSIQLSIAAVLPKSGCCGAAPSWVPRKKLVLRELRWPRLAAGTSVLRCCGPVKAGCWSVLVPFPFSFSSRLRGFLD